jgi:chorismate--pyruvate lyase
VDRRRLPPATRRWLLDEGSLTRSLVAASGGDFRVRRLHQGWQRPRAEEKRNLDLPARSLALVREVTLECHGTPWVFARSVLPATTLRGRFRHLRRFGDSSLGELLFTDPGVRRDAFEVARIAPEHGFVPTTLTGDGSLWARRSRFWLDEHPLLVCEVFLPTQGLGPV